MATTFERRKEIRQLMVSMPADECRHAVLQAVNHTSGNRGEDLARSKPNSAAAKVYSFFLEVLST